MQITRAEVHPLELTLNRPVRMAGIPPINQILVVFVRLETRQGRSAWGCTVAHRDLTGIDPKDAVRACRSCAAVVPDLHPTNIEYSLTQLAAEVDASPAALCAFDLAFHDLLGLATDMPLYQLLGGYRHKIQTAATVPLGSVAESVDVARKRARQGFRHLKVKGGLNPEEDIRRIEAIHRALPNIPLRLDVDGGYNVEQALEVVNNLEDCLEMIEQPVSPQDRRGLEDVTRHSAVPVLVDQGITDQASALALGAHHNADGFSVKVAACGGLRCARQMDSIARAAGLFMMVSCVIEPALLIAAGLSFALSSPGVRYADLDGHLDLVTDPTHPGFRLEEGWLIATDVPGLGCTVEL